MKHKNWKPYAFWILFTEAVGALAGFLTREGSKIYNTSVQQPPLSPPPIVFPIVWGILYALMGIGAARVWLADGEEGQKRSLILYLLQLVFNFFWSIIFFNFQNYGLAFIWILALWTLVLLMILSFRKTDRLAALLQIPYLLWVTFAAYLNLGVWILNNGI